MVTGAKESGVRKKKKLKVLKLNKETVRDLTDSDAKRVKGGVLGTANCACTYLKSEALVSALCGGQSIGQSAQHR